MRARAPPPRPALSDGRFYLEPFLVHTLVDVVVLPLGALIGIRVRELHLFDRLGLTGCPGIVPPGRMLSTSGGRCCQREANQPAFIIAFPPICRMPSWRPWPAHASEPGLCVPQPARTDDPVRGSLRLLCEPVFTETAVGRRWQLVRPPISDSLGQETFEVGRWLVDHLFGQTLPDVAISLELIIVKKLVAGRPIREGSRAPCSRAGSAAAGMIVALR